MSTHENRSVRGTRSTSTGLRATVQPQPFQPGSGYTIAATGGIPPYTYEAAGSPPNPPGVTLDPQGSMHETCEVDVPMGTPPGSEVIVIVRDSSDPAQEVGTRNQTS